jgi:aryl-alcohol dehydrogenase-like predicted oxidoreductase
MIQSRPLGRSNLVVSEIGLGAGPLGGDNLDDDAAVALIHAALDRGVTLIDTAPSYGRSEHRIGRAVRDRRDRVVLSTKLGYGVPGVPDWTGPCIARGIELALERLQSTWLDLAHFHSCPRDVLERGDVVEALAAAVRAGKVRVAAYSGDGDALAWAIDSGAFGAVQCSVSVVDQRALDVAVPRAVERGIGVLAKRPLANGIWRETARPAAPDRGTYWDRARAMGLDCDAERALAFVLAQPVAAALVGTTQVANLDALLAVRADPIAAATVRDRFRRTDPGDWDGVI